MDFNTMDFHELMRHVSTWLGPYLSRHLKRKPSDAATLLGWFICNRFGGFTDYNLKGLNPSQWRELYQQIGCRGMRDAGYTFTNYYKIPKKYEEFLDVFYSAMCDAVAEIFSPELRRLWCLELPNPGDGHWFGEWIEFKKPDFMRAIDRTFRRETRQNKKHQKPLDISRCLS